MAYKNESFYPRQGPQALFAILADLPAWHGTRSDANRNARRRCRKKEAKKARKAEEDREAALKSKLELLYPPGIPVGHVRDFVDSMSTPTRVRASRSLKAMRILLPSMDGTVRRVSTRPAAANNKQLQHHAE